MCWWREICGWWRILLRTVEANGRFFPVKNGPPGAAESQMDVQVQRLLGAALFDYNMVQNGGDEGGIDAVLEGQFLSQNGADFM